MTHRTWVWACVAAVPGASLPAAAQVMQEDRKLVARNGTPYDSFGQSVVIADGAVAVGAYKDDLLGLDSGAAYLFDAETGGLLHQFIAEDGAEGDEFGTSIAMADGLVVVGAPRDQDNGQYSGSAYIFDAATGEQLHKLLPDEGVEGDNFGHAVAVGSGLVIVSALYGTPFGYQMGSAFVFDASTGEQLAMLLPDDFPAIHANYGRSVSISGHIVAIGAPRDDDFGEDTGAVYLFDVSEPTSPVQVKKVLSINIADGDWFGDAVSICGEYLAVGSYAQGSGAAFVFDVTDPYDPIELWKLMAGENTYFFGDSIGVADGIVAVGSSEPPNYDGAGDAFLFDAATGEKIVKLSASDGQVGDRLGRTISIWNGQVVAGAYRAEGVFEKTGAAYLFSVPCGADVNVDGEVNILDFVAFQLLWQDEDSSADCNDDREFSILDFVCFQLLYESCIES